jgi:hypothetical protein
LKLGLQYIVAVAVVVVGVCGKKRKKRREKRGKGRHIYFLEEIRE